VKNHTKMGSERTLINVARGLFSLAALAFMFGSATVVAQDGSTAARVLEEITVTARRTEEKLQDVPVSVSAFNEASIEERRIITEYDLQVATPGLLLRQGMASNYVSYTLRGQSVGSFSYSPPSVVTYFNEVPIGGLSQTSFFDFEAIQVLKGPQGTLFGRNTTGGAITYATKRPEDEFGGYVKHVTGNYDNTELEAAINFPLTDNLSVRFAGKTQNRDGFQHNLLYDTYHNSIDSRVWRTTVLFASDDSKLENQLTVQIGEYDGQNGSQVLSNSYGADGAPTSYLDPVTGQTVDFATNYTWIHPPGVVYGVDAVNQNFDGVEDYLVKRRTGQAGGFYDVWADLKDGDQSHNADQRIISNITTFEMNENITIKNIIGYNKLFTNDCIDIDGGPYGWIDIDGGGVFEAPTIDGTTFKEGCYVFGLENWSNEFQILGDYGDFSYIIGAFIAEEERPEYSPIWLSVHLLDIQYGTYDAVTDTESTAFFGAVSYDINDSLSLSAGVRYTKEDVGIEFAHYPTAILGGLFGPGSEIQPTVKGHSDPSWEVSATYKASDDLSIYGVARNSWRSGAFNQTSGTFTGVDADYMRPEKVQDFEIGMKFSGLLGTVPARVNLALYQMEIEDVQRTIYVVLPTGPAATAGNANEAEVEGLEFEALLEPSEWLQIGGSFAYTDAKYTDPLALYGGQTFYFGPYSDTPETSYSLFVRASWDMGEKGQMALRGEFYAQDEWYYSQTADSASPLTTIPSYELINVRAEWSGLYGTNVNLAVFARNLTEEKYYAGGNSNALTGGFNAVIPGQPRMMGLEVSYRY